MLMFKERRPATRTLRGWAIAVLQEAGAIRETDEASRPRDQRTGRPKGRGRFRDGAKSP
ncbi:hypothetical protein SAMN05216338_10883 [Bradyrhizobium sp. Rc2d]|uniref:hypothetical protein n=1 Tax=Bradyrhizobium sp. Rc2d TaxID=1855321 RepID=UPI0008843D6A|nr:hypothetical protein [Bradyrhizobium sp. Rc2d]SDK10271.1 hypothetical protein SAMN05216338_10883 [Bradyrhizobium sp. Rc2d]